MICRQEVQAAHNTERGRRGGGHGAGQGIKRTVNVVKTREDPACTTGGRFGEGKGEEGHLEENLVKTLIFNLVTAGDLDSSILAVFRQQASGV